MLTPHQSAHPKVLTPQTSALPKLLTPQKVFTPKCSPLRKVLSQKCSPLATQEVSTNRHCGGGVMKKAWGWWCLLIELQGDGLRGEPHVTVKLFWTNSGSLMKIQQSFVCAQKSFSGMFVKCYTLKMKNSELNYESVCVCIRVIVCGVWIRLGEVTPYHNTSSILSPCPKINISPPHVIFWFLNPHNTLGFQLWP